MSTTSTIDKKISELNINESSEKVIQHKKLAADRLEKARTKRDDEIQNLKDEQVLNAKKGELVQLYSNLVDDCRQYIQNFVDKQIDWTNIELAIKSDKRKKNSIANYIELPLNLKENRVNIKLKDPEENESETESENESSSDSDSESEMIQRRKVKEHTIHGVPVSIDITISSFANARYYFDLKKEAELKQTKVERGAEIAFKNAEKKIGQDLIKNLQRENGFRQKDEREKFWFEKFYWFITSEGYLCLAGRDKMQTDLIYFNYFSDDDYLVSSEIEGSLKVFVKNPFKGETIPPSTILQAGIFAMSASQAWGGKINPAAWVLNGNDVSKYNSLGILPPGEFEYSAKKDFLPPAQLVMGFGFFCLVDEESAKLHEKQRIDKENEHGVVKIYDNKKKNVNFKITNVKELSSESESVEEQKTDQNTAEVSSRGRKSKLKRAAKYANQDEEDKSLIMNVLGGKKRDEEPKQKHPQENVNIKKNDYNREQHERDVQKIIMDSEEDNSLKIFPNTMDSLVQKPTPDDNIIGLIPVFAPWSALQKCKYKAKIQPGLAKKGKSMNEIINYFTTRKMDGTKFDTDLDWPEEREILKSLKSNDLIGVFTVNKMRLILPKK
ncbi:uncharacterized protein KGF55_000291 [Candida pseudojiufengensis]|uniref:uncharacterized protein n=1 Tax=Candida pseudojiufengensis TaxID=497109 RepID=UPI002223FAFE|nr:uncharacterized protein KGF55_000291 [Candida pseudojiufengensis]KAI5966882.1 hypothetical protein KGF55_000291 [Candida pseudojiufengensis]